MSLYRAALWTILAVARGVNGGMDMRAVPAGNLAFLPIWMQMVLSFGDRRTARAPDLSGQWGAVHNKASFTQNLHCVSISIAGVVNGLVRVEGLKIIYKNNILRKKRK